MFPIVDPRTGAIRGYVTICPRYKKSCFTPETRILMGDQKTTKRIYEIAYGEEIWNPVLGKAVPVRNLTAGPEALPMLEIGYGETTVHVTLGHPMVVLDESPRISPASLRADDKVHAYKLKRARDVSLDDSILGADGQYHRVTKLLVMPQKKDQAVWNIKIDTDSARPEDHMLVADGIVTGDVEMQHKLLEEYENKK